MKRSIRKKVSEGVCAARCRARLPFGARVRGAGAFLMAAVCGLSLVGCASGTDGAGAGQWEEISGGAQATEGGADAENVGLGRYVETTVLESGYGGNSPFRFTKMQDGSIAFLCLENDKYGIYVSDDGGDTWSFKEEDWICAYRDRDFYTLGRGLAPDGTAVVCYTPPLETEGDFDPYYMLVHPDGETIDFEAELADGAKYISHFAFDEMTGALFASAYRGNIYEIDTQDGSMEKLTEADSFRALLSCRGGLLMYAGTDGVSLYDSAQGRYLEDSVLQDFIAETYGGIDNRSSASYNAYVFLEEDESGNRVIYLAGDKGLHRHVLGGGAVEQVIDARLSSLGDPSHGVACAVMLEGEEFLVLYDDGKLVKFTYDADISSVPDNLVRIYSLEENDTVRQAVSVFQTHNPEIYAEYEIGMEGAGVTREDALKSLSTQLLNGSGPDVIILDGLPMDSYIDKGVLMDLSDLVGQIDGAEGLYGNLITPFYRGESLYAVPAEFRLPVIGGRSGQFVNTDTLAGLADLFETLRREHRDGTALFGGGKCTEKALMQAFVEVCAPAWKTGQGVIKEDMLREFLLQTKRVYDAQMDGLDGKYLERYRRMDDFTQTQYGKPLYQSHYFYDICDDDYRMGESLLIFGDVSAPYMYNSLNSVTRTQGSQDTEWKPLGGQCRNVYVPLTLAGIRAATGNADAARAFLRTLLGGEVQTNTFNGLPVNRKAFDEAFTVAEEMIGEDGAYLYMGMSLEDGREFNYSVFVPTEDDLARLKDWIAQSDTPYVRDVALEEALLEEGAKYLAGDADLDTAMKKLMDKVRIYAAE